MNSNTTNLTVISNDTYEAKKLGHQNYHDISSALQTTLDFHKLVATFSHKIENMVYHSAYVYSNVEFRLEIKQGVFTKNSCSYALKFEEQPLGTLKFMRNSEFHDRELALLETLLCCMIYPLRNAAEYQRAVRMAYGDPFNPPILSNPNEAEQFSNSFSKGVNAHIEYNRRLVDQKKAVAKQQETQVKDERSPWAVGFYR